MSSFDYRKKPVVIQAVKMQWDDNGEATSAYPIWLIDAVRNGTVYEAEDGEWCVKTLEGYHVISNGDYLIRGVKGELYPCKPDIFDMTYDKA